MNKKLFDYIRACPTPYHTIAHTASILDSLGFLHLSESRTWEVKPGGKYYVTRNLSSIIAFTVPKDGCHSFMITAAHSDSPAFKIKANSTIADPNYTRLSTEKYGGMIMSSWLDRPLGIAGRVSVRTEFGMCVRLLNLGENEALIPNVAIHMNSKINDSMTYNPAVDMIPIAGIGDISLKSRVANALSVNESDILSYDLILYNPQNGVEWNGLVTAPRLDDLQCAFAALTAFTASEGKGINVLCLFDNEEVGSRTKQGGASSFLPYTLERISDSLGESKTHRALLASSFLVSCDNAHAIHPNHPEYSDKNHAPVPNGGVVIKYNANQNYATDCVSASIFSVLCEKAGVPTQSYANRADLPGGSTLGNIVSTNTPILTVDVGLAQLAMHSSTETAGAKDTQYLVKALKGLYASAIVCDMDGEYSIC